ncbi:uncharacterized protein LOC130998408 [Salvia miltiorrhiza]|uniref:uncharacterized protein LOC130998408 n=1 Tax=Salvia miltiorrhiza TaxID=226208 RepID=UPI0025AC40F7|nr:uncharacterized protein LOC130998408 [Salvia miltiorrhiza]
MGMDATGRDSVTPLQKYTVAIRQLATSVCTDTFDKYQKISNTTGQLCLKKFCKAIIQAYSVEYLRRPIPVNVQQLLQMHETRHGFPGMLGSLDYMHWAWKNCPKSSVLAINPKEARFKKMQESAQKNVERAFGVLKAR